MGEYTGKTYSSEEYKNINKATGLPFGQASNEAIETQQKEWANKGGVASGPPTEEPSAGQKLFDWIKTPTGNAATAAAVAAAAAGGAYLLNRRKTNNAEQPRVEPSFNEPPPPPPPPPPFGGGTKQNFPQGDVTDVAVREVGQPRAQLTGPTPVTPTVPTSTPSIVPSTATTGVAPTFQPSNNAGYSLNPQGGYSATTLNQPTGVPSPVAGSAPAPAEAAPAPVKPLDPLAQAKVEAIVAEQRRKDEAHAAEQRRRDEIHELNKAKHAETQVQQSQGKASSQTSTAEQVLQAKALSEKNARDKAITAELKASNAKPLSAPAPAVTPAAVTPPAAAVTPPAPALPATSTTEVTPTIAPTTELPSIAQNVSEERIPSYSPKRNKRAGEQIGQGGWHFYQGQMGSEAEANWEKLYGKTNQSYETVLKDMQSGKLAGPNLVEGRGGAFPREATVPHYIKGHASLKGMGSLAAIAASLGLAGSEKGQEAMAKAAKAIKDIGFSPDILTNKGEEMGRLGTGYVTAGNPVYLKELQQKLQSTKDPEFKKLLEQELYKISPQSNSPYRSVPPPR